MLRLIMPLLILSSWLVIGGCRRNPVHEIAPGIYTLKSGVLNQNGQFRELTCKGEFEFDLSKKESTLELKGIGEARCAAASPASFVESFGGDCALLPVILTNTSEEGAFSSSGSTLTCNLRTSPDAQITVQAVGESSILLTRRGTAENTQSEIIFQWISP